MDFALEAKGIYSLIIIIPKCFLTLNIKKNSVKIELVRSSPKEA